MITHDIEEAILIADKILIFSSDPGEIKKKVAVNLKYPRTTKSKKFEILMNNIYINMVQSERKKVIKNKNFSKIKLKLKPEYIYRLPNVDIYELIGYKCYKISALNKDSVNKVSKSMKNKVNMIIGHSGVGKSTLINTISPNLMIKTSNISDLHKQGQHTTTYSEMFDLSDKIKIIDTPGIKGFGLVDMDSNEIKNYFPEFKNLNGNCKYNNCLHLNEPNCAVINALNLNKISESRYKSYLNLIDESSTYRIK